MKLWLVLTKKVFYDEGKEIEITPEEIELLKKGLKKIEYPYFYSLSSISENILKTKYPKKLNEWNLIKSLLKKLEEIL